LKVYKARDKTQRKTGKVYMPLTHTSPKEIAKTYVTRVWEEKDLTAIDEFVHPQCVIHSALGENKGPEFMKKVVKAWLTGLSDLNINNIAIFGENDLAAIHWQVHAIHRGEFKGIKPTGKPVAYSGVTIYRIHQGKIVEYWAYIDMKHLLDQIS
jgi:predicted ester cyclase